MPYSPCQEPGSPSGLVLPPEATRAQARLAEGRAVQTVCGRCLAGDRMLYDTTPSDGQFPSQKAKKRFCSKCALKCTGRLLGPTRRHRKPATVVAAASRRMRSDGTGTWEPWPRPACSWKGLGGREPSCGGGGAGRPEGPMWPQGTRAQCDPPSAYRWLLLW